MKNYLIFSIFIVIQLSCKNNNSTTINTEVDIPAATIDDQVNIVTLTDAQLRNAEIQTTSIQPTSIATTIRLNGVIDVPPQNMISISCPSGGYLRNTKLLPGMHVQRGELIATIEDQQFIQLQQDYLVAKSKLHFAELEYKRQKTLNASQASSDKVLQLADADYRNDAILLASFTEKLKLININPNSVSASNITKSVPIYSPINGFVTKINVNIGKYVTPADVLFELVNPTDIHLNLKVFEKDLNSLNIGKKLLAFTNSNPDRKYACNIILISKNVNADGTVEVHCHFDTYDPSIIPGMYMNAEVQTFNTTANSLPEQSIVNFEGNNYVFIDEGNKKYTMQSIQIGQTSNGFTAITQSSEIANKTIVTEGAYTLLMMLKNTSED